MTFCESHITLQAIYYARDNGIVVLSFPPHTSHKLQPLDVGVFGPFKSRYAVPFNDWMSSNLGKTITVRHIPKLLKKPFLQSFSPSSITSSFEKPRLWPFNWSAFSEDVFDASFIYNEPPTSRAAQEI
ncbi:hypothetical protein NQ314_003626 [Rhamnusium bicolor]|uniref:DDE-1 domain-containing protein n=1 Tax=Rhamnusium bicolor TaxID=1586634 RepID=A0AAV8ZN84_9CUCU|nr:hypothetical protein NQ314_003626 [Rhamnusium bicolor]